MEHVHDDVEWRVSPGLVSYPSALAEMDARAAAIRDGSQSELVWLLEHPPLYTAGTSAAADELIAPERFPVHITGRGGRYTYHGPGQRDVYVMLDLDRRRRDLRRFVASLEEWIVAALARFEVAAVAVPGRVGVWVETPAGQAKVAAIGVRVRRWVSFHGFAINVAPDLDHFDGIVPCGLPDFAVTSLRALGSTAEMSDLDAELVNSFPEWLRNPPVAA